MAKNIGITKKILDILEAAKALEATKLFEQLQETYPSVSRKQMHGVLSSLTERGIVYHLTRGVYAHPEAYSGVK